VTSLTLECRELSKRHSGGFVLGPLDLEFAPGVTCLVGANGAGKSTLFRLLAHVDSPSEGVVQLGPDSRNALGYLPQSPLFPRNASCGDFLQYVAWLHRVPRSERDGAVARALDVVDLGAHAHKKIKALSGGTARRLGIAQALVHGPDVLLLDEPTAGLDPIQRLELRHLIASLGDSRIVLVSTHLVEDVRGMADRILLLDEGRLRFDGTVAELEGSTHAEAPGDTELERALAHLMAGGR